MTRATALTLLAFVDQQLEAFGFAEQGSVRGSLEEIARALEDTTGCPSDARCFETDDTQPMTTIPASAPPCSCHPSFVDEESECT
jgi:hypothetical protein